MLLITWNVSNISGKQSPATNGFTPQIPTKFKKHFHTYAHILTGEVLFHMDFKLRKKTTATIHFFTWEEVIDFQLKVSSDRLVYFLHENTWFKKKLCMIFIHSCCARLKLVFCQSLAKHCGLYGPFKWPLLPLLLKMRCILVNLECAFVVDFRTSLENGTTTTKYTKKGIVWTFEHCLYLFKAFFTQKAYVTKRNLSFIVFVRGECFESSC